MSNLTDSTSKIENGAINLHENQNMIIHYQHNENIFDHLTFNLYILKIFQSKQMYNFSVENTCKSMSQF